MPIPPHQARGLATGNVKAEGAGVGSAAVMARLADICRWHDSNEYRCGDVWC